MSKYLMVFDGSHDLAWIENAIQGEEALATEFLGCQLSPIDGKITNVATFNEIKHVPADIKVQVHGPVLPAGKNPVWSGVMLVSGSNTTVDVYR